MTAFAENMRFEDGYTSRLVTATRPLFDERGQRLVRMKRGGPEAASGSKGGLDTALQKCVGDFMVLDEATGEYVLTIDLKVERRASQNLFFETHSNAVLDPDRYRPGWGPLLRADSLWYAFEDASAIAILKLRDLRNWLSEIQQEGRGQRLRYMGYREVAQSSHRQLNVTLGRLVPFEAIPDAIFRRCMLLEGAAARFGTRRDFLNRVSAARSVRATS